MNTSRERRTQTMKTYTKTFQYKGQMINYYKKLMADPKVVPYCTYYEVNRGYVILYHYKKG
jgi:hypothetical protein